MKVSCTNWVSSLIWIDAGAQDADKLFDSMGVGLFDHIGVDRHVCFKETYFVIHVCKQATYLGSEMDNVRRLNSLKQRPNCNRITQVTVYFTIREVKSHRWHSNSKELVQAIPILVCLQMLPRLLT